MKYLVAMLALAGMFVSIRAMQVHLMDPSAAPPCAVSEHWDCGTVNHSRYSWFPAKTVDEIFDPRPNAIHIPVAAIGIAGYALIAAVSLAGWRRLVLLLTICGFGCAAYLTYIEKFVIQKWCIYCVWSQGIIAATLLASIVWVSMRPHRAASREALRETVS